MASNIKSSRDEASYIIATSKHGVPRRFHIDVSLLTRRSLDDQATRNRRRQCRLLARTRTHAEGADRCRTRPCSISRIKRKPTAFSASGFKRAQLVSRATGSQWRAAALKRYQGYFGFLHHLAHSTTSNAILWLRAPQMLYSAFGP